MVNKYPMDNPSGKTGEEFLQSIANSLKALPNIKYLASEVSKLKKASKFATGSTSNSYGTGGFVTPPPPTSMTSNKVAFFASDTNWYSNIMAAIMQNEMPDKSQSESDAKYYFLTNNNSSTSETSIDTCFKSNTAYMSYLYGDNSTTGMLRTANDAELKYYSMPDRSNFISRFTIGEDTDISEIRVGDFAGIVSDRNNGSSTPTAALMLGNLYADNSSNYQPYIAKVIGNNFTIYRKGSDESFGTGGVSAPEYSNRFPWMINTSNDKYLGLILKTPFVVNKGTIYHTWQAAALPSLSNPAGGYQRYCNGINTFFAKNGISMINATLDSGSGNLEINNEFTVTMNNGSPTTTYMTQYGNILLGTINKPDNMNQSQIGAADKFSLFNRITFGKSGLITSTNLALNSNVMSIRAINDGTADACVDTVSRSGLLDIIPNADNYGKIYCVNEVIEGISPPSYWRCSRNIYTNEYGWQLVDDGYDHDKRVHWGSGTWSSSRFNANSTSQIRFYGPYDAAMSFNDNQGIFFNKRIKEGINYMSIDVTNAKNSMISLATYNYDQKLSIMSKLNNIPTVSSLPTASKDTYGEIVSYNGSYYYCNKLSNNTYRWITTTLPSDAAPTSKSLVDFVTNYLIQDSTKYIAENPIYSMNINNLNNIYIYGNAQTGTFINAYGNVNIDGINSIISNSATITNLTATQAAVAGKIRANTFENAKGTVQIPNTTNSLITYENKADGSKGVESLIIANGYNGTTRYNFMRISNGEVRYRSKPAVDRNISSAMSYIQNTANHMGQKDDGTIDWVVRPIILTNEQIPSSSSGEWAKVPDGVPIMQYS